MSYFYLAIEILVAIGVIMIMYMLFEAKNVRTNHTVLTTGKLPDGTSVKIVHISDVHIDLLKQRPQIIRNMISEAHPDVILLTGDYINDKKNINTFLSWWLRTERKVLIFFFRGGSGPYPKISPFTPVSATMMCMRSPISIRRMKTRI